MLTRMLRDTHWIDNESNSDTGTDSSDNESNSEESSDDSDEGSNAFTCDTQSDSEVDESDSS
jgi:hypothetical protein